MAPLAVLLFTQLAQTPPIRFPVSWGGLHPNGWAEGGDVLRTVVLLALVATVVAAGTSLTSFIIPANVARWIVGAAAMVAAAAVLFYAIVSVPAGQDPDTVSLLWPMLALILALFWGGFTARVHGREAPPINEVIQQIPRRDRIPAVATTELTTWTGTSSSPFVGKLSIFVAACFGISAAALALTGSWQWAIVVVVTGAAMTAYAFAWASITVRVDASGLRIASRQLPITLRTVPAIEVVGLAVADLDPMVWGGYGVRMSRNTFAYVVAGQSGIVVHRGDGRTLGVELTEGDPAAAVRALRSAAAHALVGAGPASD